MLYPICYFCKLCFINDILMSKLALFLGSYVLCCWTFGQNFTLISASEEAIVMQHTLEQKNVATVSIQQYDYLNYAHSFKIVSGEKGAPALPFFTESVLLPDAGDVQLDIEHDGFVDYPDVRVAPSKGALKRDQNPSEIQYTFGEAYSTDAFYPSEIAYMDHPFILRKTRGVMIRVNPYQYNPVTKVLRVYENIRVRVVVNEQVPGMNELHLTGSKLDGFTNLYMDHYINSQDALKRYTPLEESGDLLIITHPAFVNEMQPFVDWKIQKGIKTTLVTTDITGTTDTDIKEYIEGFYAADPALLYILLVGDHEQIPSHTYGNSGSEQLWSDSYYAQLSGGTDDYYPEVFIGRFSASSVAELVPQIERTLEYEKNPASGNWMMNAAGVGSNEGYGYGDDGEADWEHLRNIRTKLMEFGYVDVHEFYEASQGGLDAPGNPNSVMINAAVDSGIGLFNYTGHGWTEGISTGDYTNGSVNQLQNNGKYPFVVSVACNNGTFVSATCFAESWLRATHAGMPSGAIAAAGSSILMAWAEPMQTQDEIAELIAESYSTNRKTTVGGLFYNSQMSMLEAYSASTTAREVMQTWVLFGDPSCVFRTKATLDLTASHVPNVPQTTTSVVVNCNTEEALVAIVQDGELLGTGTVNGGLAVIHFPVLASNLPLTVTATKQNYRPYQGMIQVGDGPLGIESSSIDLFTIAPNPASGFIDIYMNSTASTAQIELMDVSGKVLYAEQFETNTGMKKRIQTDEFSRGVYFVTVYDNGLSATRKIILN